MKPKLLFSIALVLLSTSLYAQDSARQLGNVAGKLIVVVLIVFLIYRFVKKKKNS